MHSFFYRKNELCCEQTSIRELAARTGMTPQELAQKISQVLPQVVDKLTPAGAVPPR